jgi:hypothetical protein
MSDHSIHVLPECDSWVPERRFRPPVLRCNFPEQRAGLPRTSPPERIIEGPSAEPKILENLSLARPYGIFFVVRTIRGPFWGAGSGRRGTAMGDEGQSGRDIATGREASAPAPGGPLTWPGLVARFEELAAPIERRPIGLVTQARYRQVRLRAEELGWQAVLEGARSRSAHDVARAALGRACVATGRDILAEAGGQGSGRMDGHPGVVSSSWRGALAKVVAGLERCRPAEAGGMAWTPPKGGPRRLGKRRGLSSLPADWRARMMTHTPEQGPYGLAIACLWLLGVRPGELVRGVRVMVGANGVVLAEIRGGKLRHVPGEAPRGQPLRRLVVRGGGAEEAVARLRRALARVETRVLLVQIADARRLSDALRATSRRVFPGQAYTVSPYSFRHAWSADTKAGATSGSRTGGKSGGEAGAAAARQADDISRGLGHAAARTRTAYGTRAQGGRGGGITLVAVQASEPLRGAGRQPFDQAPPPSPSSMAAGAAGLEPAYDRSPSPVSPPSASRSPSGR